MRVKTDELSGLHLDVAVAISIGGKITRPQDAQIYLNGMHQLCGEDNKRYSRYVFSPSSSWSDCGELMESLSISCYQTSDPETGKVYHWVGVGESGRPEKRRGMTAENPRVAICRAIVYSKFGSEVELPDELASSPA